jgi:hypothetical protein
VASTAVVSSNDVLSTGDILYDPFLGNAMFDTRVETVETVEMVYDAMEILRILKTRDENLIGLITDFMFSKEYIQKSILREYKFDFWGSYSLNFEICKTENLCYVRHTMGYDYCEGNFVKYIEFKMVGKKWVSMDNYWEVKPSKYDIGRYNIITPNTEIVLRRGCKVNTLETTTMIDDYMNTKDSNLKTLKTIYNLTGPFNNTSVGNRREEFIERIKDTGLLNSVKNYGSEKGRMLCERLQKRKAELLLNAIKI